MKLPQINYNTPVQSLGREDVGLYAKDESNLMNVGRALAGAAMDIQRQEEEDLEEAKRNQVKTATYELSKADSLWDAENDGVTEYNTSDISEDIDIRRTQEESDGIGRIITQPRPTVPAYEVKPQMYNSFMDSKIESLSMSIDDPEARDMWVQRMKVDQVARFSQYKTQATSDQKKYILEQEITQIDELTRMGSYDDAIMMTRNSSMSDEKQKEMILNVNRTREFDQYDQMIIDENIVGMQEAIALFQNEEEYAGNLSVGERKRYMASFKAQIHTLTARDRNARNQLHTVYKDEGRNLVKALQTGYNIDPKQVTSISNNLMKINTPEAAFILDDINNEIDFHEEKRQFLLLPFPHQKRILDKADDTDLSVDEANTMGRLRTSHEDAQAAARKDPMDWANSISAIELNPIDWANPESWEESLNLRKNQSNIVSNNWNVDRNILTNDEAKDLALAIGDMNSAQKQTFASNVVNAMGEDAALLFEQMGDVVGGSFAISGELQAGGQTIAANTVMRGSQMREAGEFKIRNINEEFLPEIGRLLGTAYQSNPSRQLKMKDAILDHYAASSWDEGDRLGEYNADRLNASVKAVTGLIDYNDSLIEPPVKGMSGAEFETWVGTTDYTYIDRLGGVEGIESMRVMTMISSGEVDLVSRGKNQYYLQHTGTKRVLAAKGGAAPFVFKYNQDAPRYRSMDAQRAAEWMVQNQGKTIQDWNVYGRQESQEQKFEIINPAETPMPKF